MQALTKYEVKEVIWPEKTFITSRAEIPFNELPDFFSEAYKAIYSEIKKQGLRSDGAPCGFYYSWDEKRKTTDVAAAVPVSGEVAYLSGLVKIIIPGSRTLMVTYQGPYQAMQLAYAELNSYLAEHSLQKELIIEEYYSDPQKERDPAKWITNIYYLLK